MKLGIHVQEGTFRISWHIELGPHGDGMHGFLYGSKTAFATGAKIK